MTLCCRKIFRDSGQALVEYALILALASLGIVSALMILQHSLGNTMQRSGRQIDAAATGSAGEGLPGEPLGGVPGETGGAGLPAGVDDGGH